jgi:uncharacterized lipoprotein YmbA
MLFRLILLSVVSVGLTACVNLKLREDTTKTYVLGPMDLPVAEASQQVESAYIARPQLPVYMEGARFKVRSADGEISRLAGARWAEPLEVGVARALSHYIEVQSGGAKSGFYPWPQSNRSTSTLSVKFHQLVANADGRIQVSASWELKRATGGALTGVFTSVNAEWIPGDAQSMVAGVNAAMQALGEQISSSLKKR